MLYSTCNIWLYCYIDVRSAFMESYFGTGAGKRGGRFDRPWLNAEFDDALDRGNGGRLFGLRRVGKSTEAEACILRQHLRSGTTAMRTDFQTSRRPSSAP